MEDGVSAAAASAVIFDLDGTLIDSAPDIHAAGNAALAEAGLAPITLAQSRSFVGSGAPVYVARMAAAQVPALCAPERAALEARLLKSFLALYETAHALTRPYPGALELIERLAGAGRGLGLCTNKPIAPTRAVLRHFGLLRAFGTVIGGDSLDTRKPDPAPLHRALADLGVTRCLFVGDSEIDAETARAAGQPFALFTQGYRRSPVTQIPHDISFSSHSELLVRLFQEG